MGRLRVGTLNRLVSLARAPKTTNDSDGFFEALSPSTAWCAIQPMETISGDETQIQTSRITMRFHPQVSIDTRLTFTDENIGRVREFFVKSVQNVDDDNDYIVCFCEEPIP